MNLSTEKKQTHGHGELTCCQGLEREGVGSGAWAYQTQLRIDLQGDPAE